ncbi:hypothetical protein N9155_00155 [bacterium]|nr:hypothetical protein [bacterium]
MCSGGTGSANDSSNDDEKGSGNSFKETLANIFTPGDGMSYVDGRLTENNKNRDQQFYDYSSNNNNNDGPGYTTIYRDGEKTQVRKDVNDKYKQRYASALFGAATGGLPGLLGSIATNELTKGKTGAGVLGIGETAGDAVSGISKIFATPTFDTPEEKAAYETKQKERRDAMMASMQSGDDGNSGSAPTTVAPTVALPGTTMPPSSDMSDDAKQGAYQPIPNPDYDPNDPMSQQFLSNPSYAQLLAYRQSQVPGMAEGGEVGGNEKTAISDAISAVKGQMPEEQAAIALGMFVQNYGEEALKNLIERVQSGEFDDTVDRFANGEAGEVVGPGDGSGVDDKVPASLEGQQDVLLADGEFVLRKKTADALEKKYGGGFLDTVNEAEDNAPRTMQEYMARA